MEENYQNIVEIYSKDILLISKYLYDNNKNEKNIKEINNKEELNSMFKYCDKEKYFNKKGTKIIKEEEFENIISKLNEYIKIDDYIFYLFEKINIHLIKIIINGYINYKIKNINQKNIITELILERIHSMLNYDYIYFIYNKFSKIYRLELKQEENKEIINNSYEKFCKIFEIWKLIFNYSDDFIINQKYIFFYGKNEIDVKIDNIDENYISTIINISFVDSILLDINNNIEDFSFLKIYNSDEKFSDIKLKDIQFDKNIKTISNINSIIFIFFDNKLSYYLNNEEENKKEIKLENINYNNIKKIEILKNFYGKISSIDFMRKYNNRMVHLYKITPDKSGINIKLEYKKETLTNKYVPVINDNNSTINEKIVINLENILFLYSKYYPIKESLINNIKYFGGFEAFIPIFEILKFYIKNTENKNKIISFIKDILIIIINKIHTSLKNLKNFYKIIIPLTGELKSISDYLSNEQNKILFNNNIINILYLYILIGPISKSVKDTFKEVTQINDDNLLENIDYKDITLEQYLSKINSLDWYCFILFIHIEINLLIYNDIKKIPKNIVEQFSKIISLARNNELKLIDSRKSKLLVNIQFFIGIINHLYPNEIKEFKGFIGLNDLSGFIIGAIEFRDDLIFFCLEIIKIFFEIKNINLIKNTTDNSCYNKFIELFLNLKDIFIINSLDDEESIQNKINYKNIYIKNLKYYIQNKDIISKIIKEDIDFVSLEEIQIKQFIDYKSKFRHLMKEQFLFNNFWSNKKIFFDDKYKLGKIKYKYRNYYTSNFQRPIISPSLDYKNQYPKFSNFFIDDKFYMGEENKDNYNFNLQSDSFDKIVEKLCKNNLDKIKTEFNDKIIIYEVCFIKATHHIKGKIFLEKNDNKIKKFYFLSYNFNQMGNIPSCNKYNDKKNLCYGAFFDCPEKDCNIKIKIKIEDIRLIMKKIYFYRKSAIEIFTKNKSYYFNFSENPSIENYKEKIGENNCNEFFTLISQSFNEDIIPITINEQILGYTNIISNEIKKEKIGKTLKKNNTNKESFIDIVLKNWANKNNKTTDKQISTFDLIIMLNLISNRSYIDIYQYPVFPLLFFYDKKIHKNKENDDISSKTSFSLIQRDLSTHIGFQTATQKSTDRKKSYTDLYKLNLEEIKEGNAEVKEAYYFNTHYSNGIYVSNYLLRVFPYSFISIECQGNGFDVPDRLFHSIEVCFYIISYLKSDLRELIPEFFYFPEMMLNLNKLNFKKNVGGLTIDNVVPPSELYQNKNNKGEYLDIFKFIGYMKNSLENNRSTIHNWIKIIFGNGQMFQNNKKKEILFRPESYINFNKENDEILDNYLKSKEIMNSVEFGLIPIQTIFPKNEIKIDKKKYQIKHLEKSEINKKKNNNKYFILKLNDIKYETELIDEYNFEDEKNNKIKIKCNQLGKIEIYLNDKFIKEYYHQKDNIKYIDFNKKLNMFITTSLDGYSCLYSFPNKLLNVIKNPNKSFFDYILLGTNPFPFIVAYDKINQEFFSYSLNGVFINKIKISELVQNTDMIEIYPIFDAHKDILFINDGINCVLIDLPFFEEDNWKLL